MSIKMQIYASKVILYCSKKNAAQIATQYLQMKEILHSVARMNLQVQIESNNRISKKNGDDKAHAKIQSNFILTLFISL